MYNEDKILHPGTPEYRAFIQKAIRDNDRETLSKIRGNVDKPIHIVDKWLSHQLYNDLDDVITIYTAKAKAGMSLPESNQFTI